MTASKFELDSAVVRSFDVVVVVKSRSLISLFAERYRYCEKRTRMTNGKYLVMVNSTFLVAQTPLRYLKVPHQASCTFVVVGVAVVVLCVDGWVGGCGWVYV